MVSLSSYIPSAAAIVALALSLGFSAVTLRRRLLPDWEGAPAHLVDAIVGVALLIWLSELLGVVGLLYGLPLIAGALLLAGGLRVLSRRSPPRCSDAASLRRCAPRGPPPTAAPPAEERSGGAVPPAGGAAGGTIPEEASATAGGGGSPAATGPTGRNAWPLAVTLGVVALVFAHWGLTTKDALDRGIFNFDSLWYHMPFAVEMAQSHSVTGQHYTETVFTNWFYPQNSELLHAVGVLLTQRDTLSLFLNFGWLAVAFLAAWCIGRPYGRGPLTVVAAAILLESHTLVVREPGAAKNDLMAAALLLAAIAILVNAWATGRRGHPLRPVTDQEEGAHGVATASAPEEREGAPGTGEGGGEVSNRTARPPLPATAGGEAPSHRAWRYLPVGWPLAAAGLATGLAAGTKSTALAMAAGLTLAVLALAPAGRRWAAAAWWFVPVLAGGGFWYLRNLIIAGNPLPQLESLGPISLPHPERLQSGRPDFSVAHYATDTGVWSEYFAPGLHQAFGLLWPLAVGGAIAGALVALLWGRERVLRWMGGVALFGLLAYVFTPLSAAGTEGAPVGFAINIRYAIPALLAGLTLLPLVAARAVFPASASSAGGAAVGPPRGAPRRSEGASAHGGDDRRDRTRGRQARSLWLSLFILLAILVVTDRSDAVLRDPDRLFSLALAALLVLIPAGIVWGHAVLPKRHLPAGGAAGGTTPEEASATAGGGGSPAATGPAGCGGLSKSAIPAGLRRSYLAVAFTALGLAILAVGYPLQREYLRDRFANEDPTTAIPGMHLDSAYRWARDVRDARIGLAGTTAGFLQYGFYGTDLSNRVRYLGAKGPHGAFNAIPTCGEFRAAVNAADLDYLVTAPFLNFIHPGEPVGSPEAGWLRGEPAVSPLDRSGPVTVWRVRGRLDPNACGPANAPLHRIPQQPLS